MGRTDRRRTLAVLAAAAIASTTLGGPSASAAPHAQADGAVLFDQDVEPFADDGVPENASRTRYVSVDPTSVVDLLFDDGAQHVANPPSERVLVQGRPVVVELFDGDRHAFQPEFAAANPSIDDADPLPWFEWGGNVVDEGAIVASAVFTVSSLPGGGHAVNGSISIGQVVVHVVADQEGRHVMYERGAGRDPLQDSDDVAAPPTSAPPQARSGPALSGTSWAVVVLGLGVALAAVVQRARSNAG